MSKKPVDAFMAGPDLLLKVEREALRTPIREASDKLGERVK